MPEDRTQVDYFICHAYEDKQTFVRSLAQYLLKNGAKVFYDEYSIKLGDSITEKINEGLSLSRNAIIVLSKYFFEKRWTNAELNAMFQRYISREFKLLIIYHDVSHDDIREKYPLLSDIASISSSLGVPEISKRIFESTNFNPSLSFIKADFNGKSVMVSENGFSCFIQFQINNLSDSFIDKYIVDFGQAEELKNRISIKLMRNAIVRAEVTDEEYRSISLGCPVLNFTQEPQILALNISPKRSCTELYINGQLIASLTSIHKEFFSKLTILGGAIIFNSLELINPCPATVSSFSFGKQHTPEEIKKICSSFHKFYNATVNK